jgi:toxin ParE1/3/4
MPTPQLFRTLEAIADLDEIWGHIALDNIIAADHLLDELNERFRLLARNPEIGELQPLLADGTYRRFTHRNYVIYYHLVEDGIVLVRVLHGARDHERLL